MTPKELFFWGCVGSVGAEVATAVRAVTANHGKWPVRYRRWPFYIVRAFLTVIAGGLAVASRIEHPFFAVHIGAATPLILQVFSRTVPEAATRSLPDSQRSPADERVRSKSS